MRELRCQFEVTDWQENKLWQDDNGSSSSTVEGRYRYSGDITGDSRICMQLVYHADAASDFVALERVDGVIDGEPGNLVLRHWGRHDDNAADGRCEIVHATGGFEGMRGEGSYRAESQTVDLLLRVMR